MIVAGGLYCTEVLTGDLGAIQLPESSSFSRNLYGSSMFQHNGTIILCGGLHNVQRCLRLDHGTWQEHSTLNERRGNHSSVATPRCFISCLLRVTRIKFI